MASQCGMSDQGCYTVKHARSGTSCHNGGSSTTVVWCAENCCTAANWPAALHAVATRPEHMNSKSHCRNAGLGKDKLAACHGHLLPCQLAHWQASFHCCSSLVALLAALYKPVSQGYSSMWQSVDGIVYAGCSLLMECSRSLSICA
eukprot:GHRR01010946.1.p2 GENE.GHRR01010946.1~~GHRR01010946.1.p2  ORF type:complete len:146 (+),score=34.46 GHRR01010946.1:854-1291(+)